MQATIKLRCLRQPHRHGGIQYDVAICQMCGYTCGASGAML